MTFATNLNNANRSHKILNELHNIEARYSGGSVFDLVRGAQELCEKINRRLYADETGLETLASVSYTLETMCNALADVAHIDDAYVDQIAHDFVRNLDGFHSVVAEYVQFGLLTEESIDKILHIVAASTDIFGERSSAAVALFNSFSSVRYAVHHNMNATNALHAFGIRVVVMQTATCFAEWYYADKFKLPADIASEFSRVGIDELEGVIGICRQILSCGSIAEMDAKGLRVKFAEIMRDLDKDGGRA